MTDDAPEPATLIDRSRTFLSLGLAVTLLAGTVYIVQSVTHLVDEVEFTNRNVTENTQAIRDLTSALNGFRNGEYQTLRDRILRLEMQMEQVTGEPK